MAAPAVLGAVARALASKELANLFAGQFSPKQTEALAAALKNDVPVKLDTSLAKKFSGLIGGIFGDSAGNTVFKWLASDATEEDQAAVAADILNLRGALADQKFFTQYNMTLLDFTDAVIEENAVHIDGQVGKLSVQAIQESALLLDVAVDTLQTLRSALGSHGYDALKRWMVMDHDLRELAEREVDNRRQRRNAVIFG